MENGFHKSRRIKKEQAIARAISEYERWGGHHVVLDLKTVFQVRKKGESYADKFVIFDTEKDYGNE